MIRAILSCLAALSGMLLGAAPVQLHIKATAYPRQQATLYRYMDLFTQRTEAIAEGWTDANGAVQLTAEVDGTQKARLRIGKVAADLWLREGAYHIEMPAAPTDQPPGINGTARVQPTFTDLDPLDINALVADLNTRLDAFLAAGLATDRNTGMDALAKARKDGAALKPGTSKTADRPLLSPTWNEARTDTFARKLRKFYAAVPDPWFQADLEYGIAGLYLGPQTRDRDLYDHFLKGKPVLYGVPEYVRFFTSLFKDPLLGGPFRTRPDDVLRFIREGSTDSLKALLAANDLLKEDRLNELALLYDLYTNQGNALFDRAGIIRVIGDVQDRSRYPEHRLIAADMLWDLTAMMGGTLLPPMELTRPDGNAMHLDSLLQGPSCLLVVKPGNPYTDQELAALAQLRKDYGGHVRFLCIALDRSPQELGAWLKANPQYGGSWAVPANPRALLDDWRISSVPAAFLLDGRILARAPAPLPGNGLAAELHKLKVAGQRADQLKPDRGQPPPRR